MPFTYESIVPDDSVIAQARSAGVKFLVQMACRVGSAIFCEYEGFTELPDAIDQAQKALNAHNHYKIYFITSVDFHRILTESRRKYNLRSVRKPSQKAKVLLDSWSTPHTMRGIFDCTRSEFNNIVMISRYFYNSTNYVPANGYHILPTNMPMYEHLP